MQKVLKRYSNELHTYHIELWNWLAENPREYKFRWPGWTCKKVQKLCRVFETISDWHCFACAVRSNLEDNMKDDCGNVCPIEWGQEKTEIVTPCVYSGSLYYMWRIASSAKQKKRMAIIIASLPWKMTV